MPKQRFESLLANYCAPALKQYKYANMFHLPKDDDSIRSFIKQYNQQFNSKGIFFILIEQETQYTIYVYNSKLKDYISSNAVQNFLKSYQYPNTFELCIQELKKRLNTKNFPHEIGVFLGYPLDDVIGFIEHKPYYLVGDWKVYQNVNETKKQFDLFKQTKEKMLNQIHNGYELCEIIYVFLTIFLYLLKCPQSLILSALRAFCFCGKPHISRSIFLYFRYQAWLKSW